MCSGCCRGVYDGLGLVCVGFVSFSVFLRFCVLVLVMGVLSPLRCTFYCRVPDLRYYGGPLCTL
jgi:hypothetical protein